MNLVTLLAKGFRSQCWTLSTCHVCTLWCNFPHIVYLSLITQNQWPTPCHDLPFLLVVCVCSAWLGSLTPFLCPGGTCLFSCILTHVSNAPYHWWHQESTPLLLVFYWHLSCTAHSAQLFTFFCLPPTTVSHWMLSLSEPHRWLQGEAVFCQSCAKVWTAEPSD